MSRLLTDEWHWEDHLKIWWPKVSLNKALGFGVFAQHMANRLLMGVFRYDKGRPTRKAKYLTRLQAEVDSYRATGNIEHLVNAANYCYLESIAPEHPTPHHDVSAKSVTRDKMKMKLCQEGKLI